MILSVKLHIYLNRRRCAMEPLLSHPACILPLFIYVSVYLKFTLSVIFVPLQCLFYNFLYCYILFYNLFLFELHTILANSCFFFLFALHQPPDTNFLTCLYLLILIALLCSRPFFCYTYSV